MLLSIMSYVHAYPFVNVSAYEAQAESVQHHQSIVHNQKPFKFSA